MESTRVQPTSRKYLESMPQPKIESLKKREKWLFRISGLLTLGAIAYTVTEFINGELNSGEVSDILVLATGLYSAGNTANSLKILKTVSTFENPSHSLT